MMSSGPRLLLERLVNEAAGTKDFTLSDADARDLLDVAQRFFKLDREAAKYVETVIIGRTGFTASPPYVGWKGLGLALSEALDERDALKGHAERVRALEEENTRLRAALAQSELPCVYCTLPAEKWGECQHGLPGCPRSDDATGCPELGAALQLQSVQDELQIVRAALNAAIKQGGYRRGYQIIERLRAAGVADVGTLHVDGVTWVRHDGGKGDTGRSHE